MKMSIACIVLLATAALAITHRPIKIIAYPYIPDLNEDGLAGLADFLQDRFYSDTGRRIQILFDFTYATDTYTPSLVVDALSPSGDYDLQEIDTIILGYLQQAHAIQAIPSGVSFDDYPQNVLSGVKDNNVAGKYWAHPSYTCTNLFYSYEDEISGVKNFNKFQTFVSRNRQPGQYGWTGDLSSEPDLRLEYLDGWKDSHPTTPFYPNGYDAALSHLDNNVVSNLLALRDYCHDAAHHNNDCTDGDFYNNPDLWFTNFANGGSLVLQGFPEYTSEILERANADPLNPTKLHSIGSATVGAGNKPFLFTDAWVISKSNCDSDCMSTAQIFLNWQRKHWAQYISLGKDLSPQRPRFLAVANQRFYTEDLCDLPDWASDYYHTFNSEINKAVSLDTTHFWDNEDSQSATLEGLVLTGYSP